jgi:hypothetical protein
MIRSEVRKVCEELFESQHTQPDDFPLRAGKGMALAVILPEVLDELERKEHLVGELQRLLELAIVDRDRYAGEAKRLKAEAHRLTVELAESRSGRIPGP